MMNNNVTCDKCGHEFAINQANFEEICRGDIIVQYFRCTKCMTKYHVCTTNTEMRELIAKRLEIQDKIAAGSTRTLPVGTAQNLQHRLNKVIAKQKKLMPELKKRGERILNEEEN